MMQTQGPKSQIIEVLSQEFPLTARKLYNVMRKRCMTSATYHAMYQHVQELVGQGVLAKDGVEYRLDGKWIERTRQFAINTENNYSALLNGSEIAEIDDVKLLIFSNFEKYIKFIEKFSEDYVNTANGNGEILWLGTHAGGPIFYMKDRIKSIRDTLDKNVEQRMVIRGKTELDRLMANFYRSMGIKNVITGANDGESSIIEIDGDTLMYMMMPKELNQAINDIFENAKGLQDLNIAVAFEQILKKECHLFVMVTRNKKLVEKYRNHILKFFDHE